MAKTIKEITKEVGREFGEGFTKGKKFLRKRVRRPPQTSPPLAFALMPPQYYQPLQKPKPVRRRMKRRR